MKKQNYQKNLSSQQLVIDTIFKMVVSTKLCFQLDISSSVWRIRVGDAANLVYKLHSNDFSLNSYFFLISQHYALHMIL